MVWTLILFLSPDITLYGHNYLQCNGKKQSCVLSIRADRETVNSDLEEMVIKCLKKHGVRYNEVSTVIKEKIVPIYLRKHFINRVKNKYSCAQIVITNRLHSMIFAIFSRTNCIAFDNSTHKVSETVKNWLSNCPNIALADNDSVDSVETLIQKMLNKEYIHYDFDKEYIFNELRERIGGFING